jgi:hypothetical protein
MNVGVVCIDSMQVGPVNKSLAALCEKIINQAVDEECEPDSIRSTTADLNGLYISVFSPKTSTLTL